MKNLPPYITIIFLATVALTFFLFVYSARRKREVAVVSLLWLLIVGLLARKGIFQNTSAMPPRLAFVMLPPILLMVVLLITGKGRRFVDSFDLKGLTLLHMVRLPVEFVLYWLAAEKVIPGLMTFSGRNFDILSGISAPIIYFVCFKDRRLIHRRLLLIWNFTCLALLFNIVINAILSAPLPFQQFAFDQPNIVIFYFPFTWLPAFIVLVVLFSHLAAIRRLLINDHS